VKNWVCRPTFKISIYEIVFSLFAKSECRIQKLSIFGRKFSFLWKSVKSIRHRWENGFGTLKLHHDTLSKTLKKHWLTLQRLQHKSQSVLSAMRWDAQSVIQVRFNHSKLEYPAKIVTIMTKNRTKFLMYKCNTSKTNSIKKECSKWHLICSY